MSQSELHRWQRESDGRWFEAIADTDLFGTPGVTVWWGGAVRSRGRTRFVAVSTDNLSSVAVIEQIAKRRVQHGYQQLSGNSG